MLSLLIRAMGCGAAGVLTGFGACLWMRRLLAERRREYPFAPLTERLLCLAMFIPGAVLGIITDSVAMALYGILLLGICLTVSVTDWCYRIIPNPVVLALFGLKILFGVPALVGFPAFPTFHLTQSLIGMAGCFAVFFAPGLLGKQVGAGDMKLAAAMGFLLGLNGALVAIVMMGLLILGYTVVQTRMPMVAFLKTNIPMGPFIAVGMFAAFLSEILL